MNARSISKAFGKYNSVAFNNNASRSHSFKQYHSVICHVGYSRTANYTQSYTFTPPNGTFINSWGTLHFPSAGKQLAEELELMGVTNFWCKFNCDSPDSITEFYDITGFDDADKILGGIQCHSESLDTHLGHFIRPVVNLSTLDVILSVADEEQQTALSAREYGVITITPAGLDIDFLRTPCEHCDQDEDDCNCTFCECGEFLGIESSETQCDSCVEDSD